MPMNKLSELSKPVAYDYQYAGVETCEGFGSWRNELTWDCPPDWMVETGKVKNLKPRYSQEYVSALDDVAQYWIGQSAEWKERAEAAEQRIAELEAKLSEMTTFRDNALNKSLRYWEELLELRSKLATPVRLPEKFSMLHRTDFHEDYHSTMAFKSVEVFDAIRAAGFTFTVGDE